MTVQLRAHHLFCLLTYVGEGYTSAFIANYDLIAKRVAQGEDISLVDGPDDICAPLLKSEKPPHCIQQSVQTRDTQAAAAIASLLGCTIAPGVTLVLNAPQLHLLRAAFAIGRCRAACVGCEWSQLCTQIAGNDFNSTRLLTLTARNPC